MNGSFDPATRALRDGHPLIALGLVAHRRDALGLSQRGVALAQLGELGDAFRLLRAAARAFGEADPRGRARALVALAEVDLAARDLQLEDAVLDEAIAVLAASGDVANERHARLVRARRHVLVNALPEAEAAIRDLRARPASAFFVAQRELVAAELFLREERAVEGARALATAAAAASSCGHGALMQEIARARRSLSSPAARYVAAGSERPLTPPQVEALFVSPALVIDARARLLRQGARAIPLATRPILFALLRALGEASPAGVARADLVRRAFGVVRANDSHRARLRVEIGRLRHAIRDVATISATPMGFVLVPHLGRLPVGVLAPLHAFDDERAGILALLRDGQAWSSSALARALGKSQRTTQRALASLAEAGRLHGVGAARARRWRLAPLLAIATPLLLTTALGDG